MIDLLSELVAVPSINPRDLPASPDLPGEGLLAAFVAGWLQERGVQTEIIERTPGRPNVIAWVPGTQPGTLLLEAHLDTVEVEGMTIPPFEGFVRDGRLYGRGAVDTKASLAIYMHTLARLAKNPADVSVMLVAAIDEEHTFKGVREALAALKERGIHTVGAIVGEPTEMRLGIAHKGVLRFRVQINGQAGHSSQPDQAVNAIGLAAQLVQVIEASPASPDMHPLLGSATRVVTRISGGSGGNVIPGLCEIEIDRRTLPGEDPVEVMQSFVSELEAAAPGRIQISVPHVVDWALDTGADSPVAQAAANALKKAGLAHQAVGLPYGTDASKLALAGIDTLVLGPGTIGDAHTDDESVAVFEVEALADIMWNIVNDPHLTAATPQPIRALPELKEWNLAAK